MRLPVCLVPWMAMTTVALAADPRPASVAYTFEGVFQENIWRVGDECFVPQRVATQWGWLVSFEDAVAEIEVQGRAIQVKASRIGPQRVFSLTEAARKLNASARWSSADQLEMRARITEISIQPAFVSVKATLPVRLKASVVEGGARTLVDVEGAAENPQLRPQLVDGARVTSTERGIRITLPGSSDFWRSLDGRIGTEFRAGAAPAPQTPPRTEPPPTTQTRVEPPPVRQEPPPVRQEPPPVVTQEPPPVTGEKQDPPTLEIEAKSDQYEAPIGPLLPVVGPLKLSQEDERVTTIELLGEALLAPPRIERPELHIIEVHLPLATWTPESSDFSTAAVTRVEMTSEDGRVVIRLELPRPMGLEFNEAVTGFQLKLHKPAVGDGKLAGKIIVVDAGHGGSDPGAQHRPSGTNEKDLTLTISKELTAHLIKEGVTVVVTRPRDTRVTLQERTDMANRNKADLFVSVHINSNTVADSRSGNMTFYHKQDPIGKLLAECIQNEIAKVSGIPTMGVWSDQRIYDSGFAVLRNSKMPAVLLELGFINHRHDRARMTKPDFAPTIAAAVVRGLKVYFGDGKK
ncbi:MAG: N-acetylmuramoyl-L-alanine amidase [Fimbriimonadaceae bacterium]